jgi:membrane associated rhomboid family serine protease
MRAFAEFGLGFSILVGLSLWVPYIGHTLGLIALLALVVLVYKRDEARQEPDRDEWDE